MKKDHLRDYATHAFRAYACFGCPTYEKLRQQLIADAAAKRGEAIGVSSGISKPTEAAVLAAEAQLDNAIGLLADLLAVIRTVDLIMRRSDGEAVMRCLELVYFSEPARELEPGDISARVQHAATVTFMDARTVYRKLGTARKIFSTERGLNVVSKVGY